MLIKTIRWDSKFFGLKIGRMATDDFDLKIFEKEKNKFELIYISELDVNDPHHDTIQSIVHFTDKKRIYTKKITGTPVVDEEIALYYNKTADKKIIQLALQAGEYSRFRMDKNFKNKSYEHLYTKWIQNSCNKKIAFCVLIAGDIKDPEGFITLQKKETAAQVGLFAVNKSSRNKGIGKKLLAAAEYFAQKHNFDTLNVATQADNKEACRLYEKCGFSVQSSINTYHYWNKKNAHTF